MRHYRFKVNSWFHYTNNETYANLFEFQKDYINVKMLSSLLVELKLRILSCLNERDLLNCKINREFRYLCKDRSLWSNLVCRRFYVDARPDSYDHYKRLFFSHRPLTPRQIMLALLKRSQGESMHLPNHEKMTKIFNYNGLSNEVDTILSINNKLRVGLANNNVSNIDELYLKNPTLVAGLARQYGMIYFKLFEFYDDLISTFDYNLSYRQRSFMLCMGIDPNLTGLSAFNHITLDLALKLGFNLCKCKDKPIVINLIYFIDDYDREIDTNIFKMLFRDADRLTAQDREFYNRQWDMLVQHLAEESDTLADIGANMTRYLKGEPYYRYLYPHEELYNIKGDRIRRDDGNITILYDNDDYENDLERSKLYQVRVINYTKLINIMDDALSI